MLQEFEEYEVLKVTRDTSKETLLSFLNEAEFIFILLGRRPKKSLNIKKGMSISLILLLRSLQNLDLRHQSHLAHLLRLIKITLMEKVSYQQKKPLKDIQKLQVLKIIFFAILMYLVNGVSQTIIHLWLLFVITR